ncbi:hypothetical protein AAVH_24427 [Aphelenchoides avenae]|nr:hypothetical protein AAVH_24427 [Aphelenchus avenae]
MSWDGGDHEHDNDHLITRRHGRIRKRNKIIIAVGIVTLIVLVAVGVTLGVVLSRKHDTSKNVTTTVTTVKPSAPLEEKLTIAFYTGQRAPPKTNSVAWLLQQLDGGTGSSSDSTQTVLLNVAQKWKDDLASGKMTVSFVPYDKVAGQTSDTLTSYDAIEAYINNAYKNLATLGDKEDPSQTDATKKYSGSLSNKDPTASFLLFAPKISDYKGDAATDMKQAGVNLKTIADKTRKTAVAGAGLSVEQAGYYGVPASVVQVILDASQNEDEIGNIFSPPSDLSTSTQATTTTTQGLDLSKTVTIALFSGKSAAIKKDDTKQVILDIITDWKPALTAGDVKVQFIRYVDQVVDTSQVLTTADEATTYVNDAYNSLLDVTGKDASQAVATEAFLDQIKQAMGVDSAGFLLFSAPLEAYKDKAGTVDMQAAGKNLNEIAGQIATTAVAAADIPDTQLQYNLGDGMKVTVFGNALSDSGDIAEKFVPGSKPKPPVLDLGKTVTIAFFTGMTNAMSKDDVSDTQQVILDVIADWKPALAAGDVGVRFIPYTDQVQSTSKTFTTADDATKFVNDAYNALKDIGGKDANQAGAASEFFDQAKLAKNAASAGFLLFSAPHRAYADNVGTTDMQAAGKLLNHIAGTVANTAAAAADIPLNQLQYNLGDGTKVTLFGDALSDPGAIAEKFVPGSNPSQPEAPLALTISFYAGTKGAKNDPQFKETKGLLSALVAFWSKAIDSGRLTLTFIRYDTNFVASDTFTFLDAVNQYLNGLTAPTVLAAGKEPSQSSAIRHFVDASAKVPNSALLHLAAPEGDYQADAAKDMTDSGSLLKTLSTSLKHVTLAGVDISKDVLAKFGLAGADKVDIVEQAQKHAPEIANQFIPNSVPSLAKTVTIAFFSGKSNTFAKDDTQQVILDVISDWTSALTAGDVKVRFIRYTDSVQDTSKDFTTADESTKFVNDAYNALTDMGGKDASQAAAADEFLNQAVLSTNADSAGFLLFAAPLAAYKNNAAGTADMQAAGKSLNNIAVGVANAAVAAADIPANQLQYNLGDGTKVTVFGNAVSDPGDIAEKFVPGSKPSKPKTPLALSISFYAGTKDASKDQQFKDTKTLLSGLVTFWTKAINSGRLTLSFIRYDADLVASDTLTTVDAVNQYLNTLTKPTVLASGKEPSQASAIRHFVDVATKVPNSAFLHLAAPEGDYLTNAVKDMTDSGAQLRVLSVSLKHVTLSGVDIKKDVLTKFGLTAADKVNVIDEAQDHAAEIANEFSK